jgi:ATP-binding cassette subfamily B (MDR/TAP) protein 1
MRTDDHSDGQLQSLDVGNFGDWDKGVKIQLQNVWFTYPTRDVPILNGLDMTASPDPGDVYSASLEKTDSSQIEKGQFAAIVGPSGKTRSRKISDLGTNRAA